MPVQIVRAPRTTETMYHMSFINMTRRDPAAFPAVTAVNVDYTTLTDRLTTYTIHDHYALRTATGL